MESEVHHIGGPEEKDFDKWKKNFSKDPSNWTLIATKLNEVPMWEVIEDNRSQDLENHEDLVYFIQKTLHRLQESSFIELKEKLSLRIEQRSGISNVLPGIQEWSITNPSGHLKTLLGLKKDTVTLDSRLCLTTDCSFKEYLTGIQDHDEKNQLENVQEVKRILRNLLGNEEKLMPARFYLWLYNDSTRTNAPPSLKDLVMNLKFYEDTAYNWEDSRLV